MKPKDEAIAFQKWERGQIQRIRDQRIYTDGLSNLTNPKHLESRLSTYFCVIPRLALLGSTQRLLHKQQTLYCLRSPAATKAAKTRREKAKRKKEREDEPRFNFGD